MSAPAELGPGDLVVEITRAHGPAGIGVAIDAGELGRALVGKRVLIGPIDPCGECEVCRRGGAAVCPLARPRDALGPRAIVAARWVVALADDMPLADELGARVAGPLALAYTLYARANVAPRDPVIVVPGTAADDDRAIARALVQILIAKGVTPIVVIDPEAAADAALAELALAAGAALARVPAASAEADARALVAATLAAQDGDATGDRRALRPWKVIAAGPTALPRATPLCGPRAQLTLVAGDLPIPSVLARREVAITPVAGAHPDLVVEVAAMCVRGELT